MTRAMPNKSNKQQRNGNMIKRRCFMCGDNLSSKSRPTVYRIDKNYRLGAPKYLYLCVKCANKNAPTLESLIRQYEEELEQNG